MSGSEKDGVRRTPRHTLGGPRGGFDPRIGWACAQHLGQHSLGSRGEWTLVVWRDVYGFWKDRGVRVAEQVGEYLEREFWNAIDPKDRYTVRNLRDPQIWRVIGFLNPIFHPDKPKRVVSLWVSMFIGSF